MALVGSQIRTLGPQGVALFERIRRCGLVELCHCGRVGGDSIEVLKSPFQAQSLSFLLLVYLDSRTCSYFSSTMSACLPCYALGHDDNGLNL